MRQIFIILLAAAILAGCKKSSPIEPAAAAELVPLKVGNRWIGRRTTFDSLGNVSSSYIDTMLVTAEVVVGGERWFSTAKNTLRINRADGYWVNLSGFDEWMVAKYPAAVGDTFHTEAFQETFDNGQIGDTIYNYYKLISTSRSVTVPAGTFTCYEYTSVTTRKDGTPVDVIEDHGYFAPGIGLIKTESLRRPPRDRDDPAFRWELLEYLLN